MVPDLNIPRIINWVNLIVSLKLTAKTMPLATLLELVTNMNTDSSYHTLANVVFRDWSHLITNQPTFKGDVESCVTRTKPNLVQSGYLTPSPETFLVMGIPATVKKGIPCVE